MPMCDWDVNITYVCNEAFHILPPDHEIRKSMDVRLIEAYLVRLEAVQHVPRESMEEMNAEEGEKTEKHIENMWDSDTPLCEWEPDIANICNDAFNDLPVDDELRYTILTREIKEYLRAVDVGIWGLDRDDCTQGS